jgi:hypothetical protein
MSRDFAEINSRIKTTALTTDSVLKQILNLLLLVLFVIELKKELMYFLPLGE